MFKWRKRGVPWDEVGQASAVRLLDLVRQLSEQARQAFQDAAPPGVENFEGKRWKYELAIFLMFWTWYVANSSKLRSAGATEPLLNSYHRTCAEALTKAG